MPRPSPETANNTLSQREQVEQETTGKTIDLATQMNKESINAAAEHVRDPEWIQERMNVRANKFLKQMGGVLQQLTKGFSNSSWDSHVESAFGDDKENMKESLRTIRAKLDMPVPDAEDSSSESHPYLANHAFSVEGWVGVLVPEFRITRDIYYDMDFLEKAYRKARTTEQKQVIGQLLGALQTFAQYDPGRMAKEIYTKMQKQSYTDRAINKMGRITLTMGIGVAALGALGIGGLHMLTKEEEKDAHGHVKSGGLVGKELLPAAGLAGLFLFMANPSYVRGLLGSQKDRGLGELSTSKETEKAIDELSASINTPEFKRAVEEYDIQGEAGLNIATLARNDTPAVKDMIDRCAIGVGTEKDKEALFEKIAPKKATEQEKKNLRALLNDSQAVAALESIHRLTEEDAVDVARDFLTLGMGAFYRKAKKIEQDHKAQTEMLS